MSEPLPNNPETPGVADVSRTDLLCASMILQGLLASGHYTQSVRDDGENEPEIRRWDAGKAWKEDGLTYRFQSHAVCHAASILRELKKRLEEE